MGGLEIIRDREVGDEGMFSSLDQYRARSRESGFVRRITDTPP